MDAEILSFVKVWLVAVTSLLHCYFIVRKIPTGFTRLVSLLPIVYLFITLPFNLTSFHLGAPTTFYLLWLGNFKLLLFTFDRGPLATPLTLLHFISSALLPIKTTPESTSKDIAPSSDSNVTSSESQRPHFKISGTALIVYSVKIVLLAKILSIYQYRDNLHGSVIFALYCVHVYLGVELCLAITAVPLRAILGLQIEPQFDQPYLATSLQDFWGRRWNLMVTSILRPSVYNPVRSVFTPILGRKWSLVPAVSATFLVSGLIHEVIYYHQSRASPTWEVTWFFILHGVLVAAEIAVKRGLNGRWRLHRAVSGPLTLGFVAVTGSWLFFPQAIRYGLDVKAINESYVLINFVSDKMRLPSDLRISYVPLSV